MSARGYYGTNGSYLLGASPAPPAPAPPAPAPPPPKASSTVGKVLVYGLGLGFLGAIGYTIFDLARSTHQWDKELERDRKLVESWTPDKRSQYYASGLTTEAFEDWRKTSGGKSVEEWLATTPEK